MELSAPVSKYLSRAYRVLFLITTILLCVIFTPLTKVQAQTTTLPSYEQPNVDATVPQNQHTFVQSMTIEVLASFICQLADVDVFNPTHGCLTVNTTTHTLSYQQTSTSDDVHIGGLMSVGTQLLSSVYVPPASGVAYIKYMAGDFGLVKPANAQTQEQTGFDALWPVQKLWLSVRNITYIFFVLIFVLIGIGIMLRIHIDPHTIMSIQNQLPKIVMALILISFSYAIVGLLIDFMWVSTYFGINVLTSADNPTVVTCGDNKDDPGPTTLKERSYYNILNNPIAFMDNIFHQSVCLGGSNQNEALIFSSGLANISKKVGDSMGSFVNDAIKHLIMPDKENESCSLGSLAPWSSMDFSIRACVASVVGFFVDILGILIALIAILVALIRLWWTLLRAYIYIIIYTITAPFWIMFGLLPNSTMGFGRWFRTVAAHVLLFPAAAALIIGARIVMELYTNTNPSLGPGSTGANAVQPFLAPLTGNPAAASFGPLIAFGMLMLAPELLNFIRNAMQTPPGNVGQIVQGGFGVGQTAAAAGLGAFWGRATAMGGHENASGFLRRWTLGTGTYNPASRTGPNRFQRAMRGITGQRAYNPHEYPYPPVGPTGGGGGHGAGG